MIKVYKSKTGLELIFILLLIFTFPIYDLISNQEWNGVLIIIVVFLSLIFSCTTIIYTIENESLTIKFFFIFKTKVEIKSISKIVETYNPLSSPAASIDRLEIFYNKFDSLLTAPKYKKE